MINYSNPKTSMKSMPRLQQSQKEQGRSSLQITIMLLGNNIMLYLGFKDLFIFIYSVKVYLEDIFKQIKKEIKKFSSYHSCIHSH